MNSWLEQDILIQKTLNNIKKNSDPSLFNCWLFRQGNEEYFITDLKSKIKVTPSRKAINKLKKREEEYIKIYLKQYFYSTITSFRSRRIGEHFLFMFIEEFEFADASSSIQSHSNQIDRSKLKLIDTHSSIKKRTEPPCQANKTTSTPTNSKKSAVNNNSARANGVIVDDTSSDPKNDDLSMLINNLTDDGSFQNYTIDIVDPKKKSTSLNNDTDTRKAVNRNLDEAFFNDLQSQSQANCNKENASLFKFGNGEESMMISSTNNKHINQCSQLLNNYPNTIDMSSINLISTQIMNNKNLDVNIKTTKNSIKISMINEESPIKSSNQIVKNQHELVEIISEDDSPLISKEKATDNQNLLAIIDTQSGEKPQAISSTAIHSQFQAQMLAMNSIPLTPSFRGDFSPSVSHLSRFNRRESVKSLHSEISLNESSFNNFINNVSPSQNNFKRKRKLMDVFNRVSKDLYEDAPCANNNNNNESLNSSSISSSRSRSSSSSSSFSSSMSVDTCYTDITEVCSKSLIFAPKSVLMYKERRFKKSLSEKKPTADSLFVKPKTNLITQIFSPRSQHTSLKSKALFKNSKAPQSTVNVSEASKLSNHNIESKKTHSTDLTSNVLDKIISLDKNIKLNVNGTSFHNRSPTLSQHTNVDQSDNSIEGKKRRKKLYHPQTFNVDTGFEPIAPSSLATEDKKNNSSSLITNDSTTTVLSNSSSNNSNQDITKSDKSIPSGQNPITVINKKISDDKSTSLSTTHLPENVSSSNNSLNSISIMNHQFHLNPDELQSFLIENKKKSNECL